MGSSKIASFIDSGWGVLTALTTVASLSAGAGAAVYSATGNVHYAGTAALATLGGSSFVADHIISECSEGNYSGI